jgi:hypothetical protein
MKAKLKNDAGLCRTLLTQMSEFAGGVRCWLAASLNFLWAKEFFQGQGMSISGTAERRMGRAGRQVGSQL